MRRFSLISFQLSLRDSMRTSMATWGESEPGPGPEDPYALDLSQNGNLMFF